MKKQSACSVKSYSVKLTRRIILCLVHTTYIDHTNNKVRVSESREIRVYLKVEWYIETVMITLDYIIISHYTRNHRLKIHQPTQELMKGRLSDRTSLLLHDYEKVKILKSYENSCKLQLHL